MPLSFRVRIDDPRRAPGGDPSQPSPAEALAAADGLTDKEALAAFRKAVRLEPADPDYYYILGDALAQLGRHGEALPALEEAIRLSPEDPAYRYALGAVLWTLRRHEEAASAFREAARLAPEDVRAANALGAALSESGRGTEAFEVLMRAVRLDPSRADVRGNLGVALARQGKLDKAVRALRAATRLRHDPELHRNLAIALDAAGKHEASLSSFREVIRLRPDEPEGHLDLAETLFALGRHSEADAAFEKALRLDPDCLAARPESREARQAIALARLRDEMKQQVPLPARLARGAWTAVFAAGHALGTVLSLLGSLRTGVPLLALAIAGIAIARLAPPYLSHYLLKDAVVEAARAPVGDDRAVLERLMHAVRERGLEDRLRESSFEIRTRPRWRIVRCHYDVPVDVLVGWQTSLHFSIEVEEPYVLLESP